MAFKQKGRISGQVISVFREWCQRTATLGRPSVGLDRYRAVYAAGTGPARRRHDTLTIGITQFPSTLNPEHRRDGGQELCARNGDAAVHRL